MTIIPAILACLAVKATLAVNLTCPERITCPCGSKGKNVTVCVPAVAQICTRFSNCEACEDMLLFCTKCPEGLEGPSCSQEIRKSRQKRKRPFSFADLLDIKEPVQMYDPPPKRFCQDPGFIENGVRRYRNMSESSTQRIFREGESVVYSCSNSEEFGLQGSSVLTCGGDGDWSSPRPVCIAYNGTKKCAYPEKPKYGRIRCVPNKDITSCTGYCLMGYHFKNSETEYAMTLTCTTESGWTPQTTFPDCQLTVTSRESSCQDPGFVENAIRLNVNGSESSMRIAFPTGSTVIYSCTGDEFTIRGSPRLTCQQNGAWTHALPVCARKTTDSGAVKYCPDPGTDVHGSREPGRSPSPPGFLPGSRLEYSCNEGYRFIGESSMFCLASGQWSGIPPRCEEKKTPLDYCENPGIISNGQVVYHPPKGSRRLLTHEDEPKFPEGARLEYSCDTGHKLLGRGTLICEKPGSWSEDPPFCRRDRSRRRYCMYPGNILNGQVEHIPVLNQGRRVRPSNRDRDEYPEGSRLQYSCEDGYTPVGPTTLTCKSTGSWSPAVPPTCVNADYNDRAYCENPGSVLNGKAWYFAPGVRNGPGVKLESEMEEYPEGSSLEFYCDKGFWLQGSHSLTCDSEGFWSAVRPTCVGDCGRTFVQSSVRIRDGQETMTGEWPWVVSISLLEGNSSRFICGGAVFNTRTVLTAAHCLQEGRTYILRFGKHQFRVEDDDSLVLNRMSSRVIIHHDYSRRTLDSDIGLILFQEPIEYSARVQPICMPTIETTVRNIVTGRVGYVSGWGDTELELPSNSLLFAGLPVLSMRSCVQSYMRQNLTVAITGNMFCAGYYNGTYSVCGGDSGSPFVFYDNLSKRFTLEGLVSFVVRRRTDAQACGLPGRFAIFTRVFRFVPWIYENIE